VKSQCLSGQAFLILKYFVLPIYSNFLSLYNSCMFCTLLFNFANMYFFVMVCIFIVIFIYSYYYVCSVMGILFHCVVLCIVCV
jgi:hypothetical protein